MPRAAPCSVHSGAGSVPGCLRHIVTQLSSCGDRRNVTPGMAASWWPGGTPGLAVWVALWVSVLVITNIWHDDFMQPFF